ncbi:MAG: T9SS type A sorting domain-containing protein [Candidatus Eisenbacteria bacterium]|nr:T9SS type A sorting domain-containing protein [Candidatus Eisenbacteria bacterium]
MQLGSSVLLENCLIAFNNYDAIVCSGTAEVTALCSDIFGNPSGDWVGCLESQLGLEGNISADPLFCDLEGGDVHLSAGSPCLPGNGDCGLIGAWGQGCGSSSVEDEPLALGGRLLTVPNPFARGTAVAYRVPTGDAMSDVRLRVYDVRGRLVEQLVHGPRSSGEHFVSWDGRDFTGRAVNDGVYFYRLDLGRQSVSRPVIVLR